LWGWRSSGKVRSKDGIRFPRVGSRVFHAYPEEREWSRGLPNPGKAATMAVRRRNETFEAILGHDDLEF